MRTNSDPWWLVAGLDLIGFETQDDDPDDVPGAGEDEGNGEGDDDDDEQGLEPLADLTVRQLNQLEELDDDEREELAALIKATDPEAAKTDGLKSALRKERQQRKELERELRKLKGSKPAKKVAKKAGTADEGDEEVETTDTAAAEREQRLATKLAKSAVDAVILQYGGEFTDTSELLALVDRREIDVDQDEDDPSEIEVDKESVKDAVMALAKKSPHLLKKTNQRKVGSGSKLGGGSKKRNEPSEEELRKKYPALRRG